MRRLRQETLSYQPPHFIWVVNIIRRAQASIYQTSCSGASFDKRATANETTSFFPENPTVDEVDEQQRQRRHRGNSVANALLDDIFELGKRVADEHKRSRVSIPASSLRNLGSKIRVPKGGAASKGPTSPPAPREVSLDEKPVIEAPLLSASAPVVSAGLRHRRASSPPPASQSGEAALPPLQSWTPAFALTPQHLEATSDAHGASDIAFTLEELENTLFSPALESVEGGATIAKEGEPAKLFTPPPLPPPPPPPPMAPALPCSEAPPAPPQPVSASSTVDPVGPVAPLAVHTAAHPEPAHNKPTPAPSTVDIEPCLSVAENPATTIHVSSHHYPSSKCRFSPDGLPTHEPHRAPLLQCRLRGSAVVVSLRRPYPTPRELLEALHEAVSFAESLPTLPQGSRHVHLGVDSTNTACASCAFLEPGGWPEIISQAEERVAIQFLKERLLQRMAEGPERGLCYIAELRRVDADTPLVIHDTAAELLLACTAYEMDLLEPFRTMHHTPTKAVVQLSFSGIGVGVLPAPWTVRRLAQAVTALCNSEAERALLLEALARAGGRPAGVMASTLPRNIVAEVIQRLHAMPHEVSAALLMSCTALTVPPREGFTGSSGKRPTEKSLWLHATWSTARRWWERVKGSTYEMRPASNKICATSSTRMSACVTASEVWWCLCDVMLSPDANEFSTYQAISDAMHSLPIRRSRQNYLAVASPAFALTTNSPSPLSAVVVDVTASSLRRASVADLVCEICDQPADVILVLSQEVPHQQKLQFLASLQLANTSSHHSVTVLLPGDPAGVAECVCLTRSSAHLVPQQAFVEACSSKLPCSDPRWPHQLVEVSDARTLAAAPGSVPGFHGASPASLAELYVTHVWRHPCVTTRTGTVGLEMSATVAFWSQRLITGARGGAKREALVKRFYSTHLAPLVLLRPDATVDSWTTRGEESMAEQGVATSATVSRLMKGMSAALPMHPTLSGRALPANGSRICVVECGIAFLCVLDVACHSLLRRAIDCPEKLNALSIAALGLDSSAGGLVETADRVAGDDMGNLVSAMERAAVVHGIRFASLPLLRWLGERRLLLYQLTPHTIDRYITYAQQHGVEAEGGVGQVSFQ
ncbi:hypothetical protein JKF63_00904 [Porcisia hertigi]|uniref:Uncharacterized protein n=1 Tax=Porcisia hertigi TaxID=2761500 RepID=A0A836GZ53_9TRYP|nr:hypothetical protein JKF63_00904 [Porcisia hertigi]